ncbi:MAG: hypothetical protein A2469_00320 [Candidatus Magasanikbacteria bacterium RIFOXYC2_FULL_40_16]|uniref:Uncharacterized protein n=1 Tax=Candidatus Magasanikbacteria bacterium RIFOXYC2_FULL_40_16 TaxID=1798703 RepID=A0A1F6P2R7_9BACT|nr:MAG: hypothetical protein A2224_00160 [Candidatus Magasanikbacteria bacterium RIFOXYA2_FULL_40_20]OGH86827.1 MAG: hypothetical protein A2301_02880 [Candidatus Magasanikbacteria bacterium RIFOXYB2_FULL_40_13]OGH90431.1 MAG: hypothetical protein A2469_00320 [Candidatus Magasanikbacteria bacterium RIFOXYC2_FULL_40_16]
MSTEAVNGKMKFTDYLACWLGFVIFFTLIGGFLGFLIGLHFGLTDLLYLCLLVSSVAGAIVGLSAVIVLAVSNRELHPVRSSAVNAQKIAIETAVKSKGWSKRDYYCVVLVCLAIGLGIGIYFGTVFSRMMIYPVASFKDYSLMGLGLGLLAGLAIAGIHYGNESQDTFRLPKARARFRANFPK